MVDRSTDEELSRTVDDGRSPRMPRWVKVFLVVVVTLVLLVVIVIVLGGGEHGPGRHMTDGAAGGVPPAGLPQRLVPLDGDQARVGIFLG